MKRILARRVSTAAFASFALVAGVVPGLAGFAGVAQAATLSVSPPAAINTSAPFTLTVNGVSDAPAGAPGLSLELVGPGGGSQRIAGTGVTSSGSTVKATVDLSPADLPTGPGSYHVNVCVDPAGLGCDSVDPQALATDTGNFLVVGNAPGIATVAPAQRAKGSGKAGFTFTGSNIANGATAAFYKDGTPDAGITPVTSSPSPAWSGGNTMTQTFTVTASALLGLHQIKITNTDGQSVIGGVFTVSSPPTVAPADFNVGKGVTDQLVHLTGTGFQPGLTVSVAPPVDMTPEDVSAVPVFIDSTHLDLKVSSDSTADNSPLTNGERAVTITNPDGGSGAATAHIVDGPDMTLASGSVSTPDGSNIGIGAGLYGTDKPDLLIEDVQYDSSKPPTITLGNGVVTHGAVSLSDGSNSTPVFPTKNITVLDLVVPTNATVGALPVTVKDPDTSAATTCDCGVSVTAAPTLVSATPSHRGPGASPFSVGLSGTNFEQTSTGGTLVKIGTFYTSPALNSNTGKTSVTTTSITIPGAEPRGPKDILLSRVSDGGAVVCHTCFNVDDFDVNSISVSNASNSAEGGATGGSSVTIGGAKIPISASNPIKLYLTHINPAVAEQPDIVVSGVVTCAPFGPGCAPGEGDTFTGSTSFLDVAPGYYQPRLATADNSRAATCNCSQFIVGALPTIATVAPASVGKGAQSFKITLTGDHFFPGAVVKMDSGVTDASVVADSTVRDATTPTTKLTFLVNVNSGAALGDKAFFVQNVDGFQSANNKFTVVAGPTLTKVTPTNAGQGVTGLTIAVEGTGIATGATFGFGDGVTVQSGSTTVAADGKSASMKIDITNNAANGARDVSVANTDGGTGILSKAFTVNLGPTIQSVSSPVAPGTTSFPMKIVGANYVATPTVTISGTGVTIDANGVKFDDAGNLTVKITVASNAARGGHNVTVKNPDGGTVTCTGCLVIANKSSVPRNFVVRPGDGQFQMSFDKPADDGGSSISSYTVTCFINGTSPKQEIHSVVVPASAATTYTVLLKTKAPNGGAGIPVTNDKKYSCDAVANTAVGPGAAALQGPVMPTGVQRLVGMKPVKVVNSATGLNTGVPAGKMTTREFDFTLAGAPTNATGAVLSASLNGPAKKSTVKLYGTNTPKTPMTAYAPAGISKTGTVLVNFASATRGKVHVSLTGGPVYLVVYQTGWLIRTDQADAAASSTGGRFVPAHVQLAKNATVSSQFPPNSPTYYSPDLGSGIEAVAIQLSTLNTRSNGSVVAYSTADGPVATAHTFTNKRTGTTLVISRVSSAVGKCTTSASETAAANRVCLKVNGLTGINAVIVGYWKKDVTEFPGRAVLFGSQRVLTGTSPTPGEIRVKIPDSVPSSATSVLLQVTGFNTAGPSIIRVYPDGSVAPIEFTVYTTKGDTTTNIGLTPLGANRYVRLKVYGSSAQLNVDVVGYVN